MRFAMRLDMRFAMRLDMRLGMYRVYESHGRRLSGVAFGTHLHGKARCNLRLHSAAYDTSG